MTVEYTGKITYADYEKDKMDFYGQDARYEEHTDMSECGDSVIYNKRVHFCSEDQKIWGCWVEILTRRVEPIFKVLSTHPNGDGIFTQTVQKIGERTYEDMEYFDYGDGFKTINGSRFVHCIKTRYFEGATA